jgi:hypothetical protein
MKDLWENFYFWLVVADPDRGLLASRIAICGGCALALSGVVGVVAKGAVNALKVATHQVPHETLESAFPQFPTWWVPETFMGYLLAICFVVLGCWLTLSVKQTRKFTGL